MSNVFKDKTPHQVQFDTIQDEKMRKQLSIYADGLDEKVRKIIIDTYNDKEIRKTFDGMRNSDIYTYKNSKAQSHAFLKLRFPNGYVFAFVETLMTFKYGTEWLQKEEIMTEPLVQPWRTSNHKYYPKS